LIPLPCRMPRADGRADGPPGWGVSSSRRLAGATPEELTAAQACDGIGAAVPVEEEQPRIRRSAAPARGHFRHLPQQLRTPKASSLDATPGTELPAISSTPVSR